MACVIGRLIGAGVWDDPHVHFGLYGNGVYILFINRASRSQKSLLLLHNPQSFL